MNSFRLVICMLFLLAACNRKDTFSPEKQATSNCLNATVINALNADCGYPLLSFAEDSIAIRTVTGQQNLLYVVKYLPEALSTTGKRLCVTVAKLQPGEEFPCAAFGISYPHLKIISAKERE